MQDRQPSLFARDDTFFGVCQGLGEDLRISPDLLRVALTLLLFFQPLVALGGYAAAGVLVFLTRWLFPNPRVSTEAEAVVEAEPVEERLPIAA